MRLASKWLLAVLMCLATATTSPAPALARGTKVDWKKVETPIGQDQDRRTRELRTLLVQASRSADFGKTKSVVLSARIVEFTSFTRGDVHRVSCTILGRVAGGPTAKSKISFGGRPAEREALEKQVLTMVANGVVGRLAQIVRARARDPVVRVVHD
jgi:hypothetical protein